MNNKKLSMTDMEKIVVGILLVISTFVTLFVYLTKTEIDPNIVYLVSVLLTAFIVRKGLKYNFDAKMGQGAMKYDDQDVANEIIKNVEDTVFSGKDEAKS